MTQITIAGKSFELADKYAEGHTLTAAEASAFNQLRRENIRNNFANAVKTHAGTDDELTQAFSTYADAYEFGQRSGGGGGSRDPVEVEALSIARETVRASIRKAGKNVSDYSAAQISESAKKLVEKNPAFRAEAQKRIAALQEVASSDTDILGDLGEPQGKTEEAVEQIGEAEVETAETGAGKRGRKSAE